VLITENNVNAVEYG